MLEAPRKTPQAAMTATITTPKHHMRPTRVLLTALLLFSYGAHYAAAKPQLDGAVNASPARTLPNFVVIFTSDNGPAVGKAGPLRGKKGSTFEGGMREATVIRWPGRIPAGKDNDELMSAMDLLPTFAKLAGAKIPTDRVIDGKDIWPVLSDGAKTPHGAFFYHRGNSLNAVRSGKWKLHATDGKPTQLFDLENDIGETKNVLKAEPKVVQRLTGYLTEFAKDIAENSRPAAFVENPKPLAK